jgi:hypothetical protein
MKIESKKLIYTDTNGVRGGKLAQMVSVMYVYIGVAVRAWVEYRLMSFGGKSRKTGERKRDKMKM